VLQHAEAATVRLMEGSPSTASGWGSGTLISSTGLILTNVHVAEPQAPGFAVGSGLPRADLDHNPPYLMVEMTDGPSSPVVARYRARPVAADGYLDLATVQIYATASGRTVSPGSLHLPYLKLGNVAALQLDQNVTVLGFPGVADSDSITVTSGVLSTFVPGSAGSRCSRFPRG
jgi:putative serine protease PepD